jgi:DNA mismatch repair protein MutS2
MKTTETILNFQTIRQQVMQFLQFDLSLDYVDTYLKVETTYERVQTLHAYTQAFYDINERLDQPKLLALQTVKTILQKTKIEANFLPEEALLVANLYDNAAKLRAIYRDANGDMAKEQIDKITHKLIVNDALMQEIRRVITKDARIADDASAELRALRSEQRTTEQSIRRTLNRLMQSEQTKMAEDLYTVRNSRYVLPIKAEFKHTFNGILHDQSASGTTVYMEPQALVTINNKLQQLALAEAQEITRILHDLSVKIWAVQDELAHNSDTLARFDIYQAKALYSQKYNMSKVSIIRERQIALYDAKHPLLQKERIVGNDILLGNKYNVLMITGANTGGKSVFLKTLGLHALMAQTGLFLPVSHDKDNQIGVFADVFVSIGDEQSLEANLSTFSGHLSVMKHILQKSNDQSLVLLDELGTGTDPVQGAALAIAMIESLAAKGALIVGTTHFNEMKAFIMEAPFAENAAMVFDLETLSPTFKVRYGSYGGSYAFDIAAALALPQDIIMAARSHAASFAHETDNLLLLLEQRLQALDVRANELQAQEAALMHEKATLATKLAHADADIARERKKIIGASEHALKQKLQAAEDILERVKQKQTLKQNEYADLKGSLNSITVGDAPSTLNKQQTQMQPHEFSANDTVYVPHLQTNGTLVKKQGNKWVIKLGKLSMTLQEKDFSFVKKGTAQKKKASVRHIRKQAQAVSDTLDLRGFRVLDAIDALETYLANAASGHKVVRIIHGHGTGQVRDAVQKVLRTTKSVKGFRFGGEGEGGVGATIVEFY